MLKTCVIVIVVLASQSYYFLGCQQQQECIIFALVVKAYQITKTTANFFRTFFLLLYAMHSNLGQPTLLSTAKEDLSHWSIIIWRNTSRLFIGFLLLQVVAVVVAEWFGSLRFTLKYSAQYHDFFSFKPKQLSILLSISTARTWKNWNILLSKPYVNTIKRVKCVSSCINILIQ